MIEVLHFFPSHEEKFEGQAKRFFTRDFFNNEWRWFSKDNIDELAANFCERDHLKFDWVIFHSAPNHAAAAIETVSNKARVLVQFWGADYASILIPQSRMFLPRTRLEFFGRPIPKTISLELLKFRWYLFKSRWRRSRYLRAFANCEHLCFACGDSEWKWMPPHYQTKRLNWFVNYSAGNSDLWRADSGKRTQRVGALIGNSAAATNNHLDVLEKLKQAPQLPSKMVIPLSYGSKAIAKTVKEVSERYFGMAVMPLLEFMPANAYFDILNQCEFVIMGHMRQQALGNLKWAFSSMRTVYLWENSDMHEHFKSRGFTIRTIESIPHTGLVPLDLISLKKNADLVELELLNSFEDQVLATFTAKSSTPSVTK